MQRRRRRHYISTVVTTALFLFTTGSGATAPRDLPYDIDEESDVGTPIAHLASDAGLRDRYPPEVAGYLYFRSADDVTVGSRRIASLPVPVVGAALYWTRRVDRPALRFRSHRP